MSFALKSKKLVKLIVLLVAGLLGYLIAFWSLRGTVWTASDFQVLDLFYRRIVEYGYGPPLSSQIVYITITDETYDSFGRNILDRSDLARINAALAELGVEAVAYDIIFARPSHPAADQQFATSIAQLGSVYLPIGFAYSPEPRPFRWEAGEAYERLRSEYLHKPRERGTPQPFYATHALMQMDAFAAAAFNAGHISATSDADGVYRHLPLLLKIDSLYFPTLALSMFLDYVQVPWEKVLVHWGREVVIPATPGSFLERDVVIPIDERGRVFIPYPQVWARDFPKMEAHRLLQYFQQEDLRGNLLEFLEGKFVFIGDIAVGTSDLGQTPLEAEVPLIILHTSLLNGLLTHTFYRQWSFWQVLGFIALLGIIVGVAALPRPSWILYATGGAGFISIIVFTWVQFTRFSLFPVVTVGGSFLFLFFGLVVGLQIAVSREQAFIRNAFAKYVPETVVNELLMHPELLQLGGEERVLSVLFSDLAGFTTIAEQMSPPELVSLLNQYLTEMTDLILAEGGIIDKYQGDAIMAEFGAPLPLTDHADRAVRTALKMQRRLQELRQRWKARGLPALECRVGINTGPMIIGNMGSHQIFDYTVIGDAVNLASRLEGANKRYGTTIMISEFTHACLTPGLFRTRVLDVIRVKGKAKAVRVFEVYGEGTEPIDADDLSYYQAYQEGFAAYLARDFTLARAKFDEALSLRPGDLAAQEMLTRLETLKAEDLPADWDGSIALTEK
ncbi:MAG: adenylate/guanylate cyclase domain-containing protein [Nitrospinota bacterium]|nr:MAG: adenylate/guanylate cyclase domain-containing protein [Nitrospinota bacterium]